MKKKLKHYLKYRKMILPFALLIIIIALASYILLREFLLPNFISIPELSTQGYTEVAIGINITDDRGVIYLSGNCFELPVVIEKSQAVSIENGINGIIGQRPNTHDLVKDMLKGLDANIMMLKITEMKEGTYYSRIILRKGNLILGLDSRPSDALAIAARTEYEVPVYVKDELLKTGTKIC